MSINYDAFDEENGEFQANSIIATERINIPKYNVVPSIHDKGSMYYNTTNDIIYKSDGVGWSIVNGYERNINVAQKGGDFADLVPALNYATTITPTATNPISITIYPGTYIIDNSLGAITIPNYVSIKGHSYNNEPTVHLKGNTAANDLFVLSKKSSINEIYLCIGNALITSNDIEDSRISNCIMTDCVYGVKMNVANKRLFIYDSKVMFTNTAITYGFYCDSGSSLYIYDSECISDTTANFTNAYYCDGVGSVINTSSCLTTSCNTSYYCDNSAQINISGGFTSLCIRGLFSGSNCKLVAIGHNINVIGASKVPIELKDSSSSAKFIAGRLSDVDKIIRNNGFFVGQYHNNSDSVTALNIESDLSVGNIYKKAILGSGGGVSHRNGVKTFRCTATSSADNGSGFVDTTNFTKLTNNTTPLFGGTTANLCCVVFCSDSQFPGILYNGLTPILTPAGGIDALGNRAIICEYWNGLIWEQTYPMVTDGNEDTASSKHYPHADFIFPQLRTEMRFSYDYHNMALLTIPAATATAGYWLRFRLISNIVTDGTTRQIWVHSLGRMQVDYHGLIEIFNEQTYSIEKLSLNSTTPISNSPGNQNIFVDSNFTEVGLKENSFSPASIHSIGFTFSLPVQIDTSKIITFVFRFMCDNANAGNVIYEMRLAHLPDNTNNVPGVGSGIFSTSISAPANAPGLLLSGNQTLVINGGSQNKLLSFEVTANISRVIADRDGGLGDLLVFNFIRKGSDVSDTYPGNINLIDLHYRYMKWRV